MNTKYPTKINGEFLYQLDQNLEVHLLRDAGEVDGIIMTLVLCENRKWLDDGGKGDELPETLTVHEARNIIRNSIFPLGVFSVEPAYRGRKHQVNHY